MERHYWLVALLVVLLIIALGVACNRQGGGTLVSGRTMPAEQDASKWPVHEVLSDEFQIPLPPNWWELDVSPNSFHSSADLAIKRNPKVRNLLANLISLVGNGLVFLRTGRNNVGRHVFHARSRIPRTAP
jgi:hypothetical protein